MRFRYLYPVAGDDPDSSAYPLPFVAGALQPDLEPAMKRRQNVGRDGSSTGGVFKQAVSDVAIENRHFRLFVGDEPIEMLVVIVVTGFRGARIMSSIWVRSSWRPCRKKRRCPTSMLCQVRHAVSRIVP